MRRLLIGVLAALASASVAFAQDAKRLDRHGEPLPAEAVLCDPLTDAIKCKIASLIPPAKQRPYGAFFSHDAKTYVHVDEGSISLIDTASGKEKDSLAPPGRRPCAPSRCWRRFRARRRPRRCKPSRGKTRIIR